MENTDFKNFGYVLVSKLVIEGHKKILLMGKDEPEGIHDSGWRFLSGAESSDYLSDENNILKCSIDEILALNPKIEKYLGAETGAYFKKENYSKDFKVWYPIDDSRSLDHYVVNSYDPEYEKARKIIFKIDQFFTNCEFLTYEFSLKNKGFLSNESVSKENFEEKSKNWLKINNSSLYHSFSTLMKTGETNDFRLRDIYAMISEKNGASKSIFHTYFFATLIIYLLPDDYLAALRSDDWADFEVDGLSVSEIRDYYNESIPEAFVLLWMMAEHPDFQSEISYIYGHRNVYK